MAVKDTKKLLEKMVKSINDDYARGLLDKEKQIVTLEFDNIVEAWKEGYLNLLEKHPTKGFPDIESINWKSGVRAAWNGMRSSITRGKGTIVYEETNDDRIVFKEPRMTQSIFTGLKSHSVSFIQAQLNNYKLTNAKDELHAGNATKGQASSFSDIGKIKSGSHRLHKGNTGVGSARLAMSMKWLSKTRFFNEFLSSEEAKTLQDSYKELIATWKTTGTKKGGLKVTPKEKIRIGISVGPKSSNKKASEKEDFTNIYKALEKIVIAWAENAQLAGRKGSKSIEDNAVDIAELVVVGHLAKIKGAKVKKKTTSSKRKAKSVSITKKGKSMASTKSANSRKRRKKAGNKGIASSPLAMIAMINKELPDTIRKNMGSPALVNRTGRFSESAIVTDVVKTPKGFPSFGYTYQKYPYQTFEPGFAQGSAYRDPRQLIDRSIREIATQFAIGRLYTRRQ
jgi:hypothetical protein